MVNRKAPLPDGQELIFTGHGKEGDPGCEKRDFLNKILQTGGR
jgi:hypothetical protein